MNPTKVIAYGFLAGFGFMAGQDLWGLLTGMVGLCYG
jgi:hypothetical protein